MAIWNDTYNSLPKQGFNPGYGAREFQGLKSRIVDRMAVEHIFGEVETDSGFSGGKHREGSARVAVEDGLETVDARADYRTSALSSLDEGRVNIDLTERSALDILEINGEDGTTDEALRYKILSVVADFGDVAVEVVEVFNYDRLVNISFDQTISGTKIFDDYVQVEDIAITASFTKIAEATTNFTAPVLPATVQDVMPMNQIRDIVLDAKDHNILDGDDTYNTSSEADSINYTDHSIHVQYVYAEQGVFGAVWG